MVGNIYCGLGLLFCLLQKNARFADIATLPGEEVNVLHDSRCCCCVRGCFSQTQQNDEDYFIMRQKRIAYTFISIFCQILNFEGGWHGLQRWERKSSFLWRKKNSCEWPPFCCMHIVWRSQFVGGNTVSVGLFQLHHWFYVLLLGTIW